MALVGAGNIAETHASVLSGFPNTEVVLVLDPDRDRAERFARRWAIPNAASSLDELSDTQPVAEVAHVLVPPQFHMPVASRLLRAGLDVLIEKPMAQSPEECEAITAAAEIGHSRFYVNHNFRYHPAHQRALGHLQQAKFGRLRHVSMVYNMPLRQLSTGQLRHWMFDSPRNLLLEQAVHPLSLLDDFVGPGKVACVAPGKPETHAGQNLVRTFLIGLQSDSATAQLDFALGETYPIWRALLVCDDGAISVDYLANSVAVEETRRSLPPFADLSNGISRASSLIVQEFNASAKYVLSTLKLIPRADNFFVSMRNSIGAFYKALSQPKSQTGVPPVEVRGHQARRLVTLCDDVAARVSSINGSGVSSGPKIITRTNQWDVAVIGGTGFLGQHVVSALLREGKRVAVMARNVQRLPSLFDNPNVALVPGEATNYQDVCAAIDHAEVVIHLAHGGGADPAEIHEKMVGAARVVGEACLETKVKRLIFISSIAALYLGDTRAVITAVTEPDPRARSRAAYSQAKAETERLLLSMSEARSLPVCILRPGLVVGQGGTPFHGGIGIYPNERHCLGWNRGDNPLPFVLAADVAEAIIRAIDAPNVVGKCLNLVGGVRLTAAEYVRELARVLERPLRYHPQSVYKLFVAEAAKHLVKLIIGRREPRPTLYDLRSRGLLATFDCSDTTRLLGWEPTADRARFVTAGIQVHAQRN